MIQKQTLRSERSLRPASLRPVNCHSRSCLFPKFACQVSMGAEGSFSPFPKNRVSRGLELASPLKSFSKETWAARPCGWQRVVWLSEALSGAFGWSAPPASNTCSEPAAKSLPRADQWAHVPSTLPPRNRKGMPAFSSGPMTRTTLVFPVLRSCQSNLVLGVFWGKPKMDAKAGQCELTSESWIHKRSH